MQRVAIRRVAGTCWRRALPCLLLLPYLLSAFACTNLQKKKLAADYGPTESVLEVVSVLRRHVPDDTYRFPPATDFTGRNVYRSSLLRLENIERIHADALRSGYMDSVIDFAKGRALERLRAYDLAASHYREAARFKDELAAEAQASAALCERLAAATAIGLEMEDPVRAQGTTPLPADPESVIAGLEARIAVLSELRGEIETRAAGPDEEEAVALHYAFIAREEIERADEIRAAYFERMRFVLPDGALRAAGELQRLVARHGPSKRRLQHLLRFAAFYDELAHEYVDALPPESLNFDPARFQELVDPATQLYQAVATQDGTPEKLEAARRLEAFLAFTLRVDRDRFTR